MKQKLCILTLVGLVAWSFAAVAQDDPPAGELQSTNTSVTTTNDAAPPASDAKEATPAAEQQDAPAQAAADTNVVLMAANETPAVAAPVTTGATDTNAPADPGAIIPLIVMDDVPLTDAIKNLARQAGLNYILDPKVSFGQVGPDGRAVPQPSVSIRWENVTAAQALGAMLGTYNLQLVEDPKSKIARVTVKDPAAPDPLVTRVVQLKWASPTNILTAMKEALAADKRSKVIADVRTSQLVVLATEKDMVEIEKLVEKLDLQTKQVLIEARLLETSMNPSTSKGIDWSGTLANQHVRFGNNAVSSIPPSGGGYDPNGNYIPPSAGTPGGILSDPMLLMNMAAGSVFNPAGAFLNADGVSAVLSFLNKYAEAKVISTPRTVTLDNETAKIEVTRASPIITVTPGTVQVAGGSSIQYTNLGVILNVTPRISANDYINLKVIPEVSRIFDTVRKTVSVGSGQGVYEADEYDIRRIETRVMIPSGNTLVLGGLVQDDIRTGNTKVPVLGDIPGLGYLFRSDTKARQKSNLLVFLTPTIVQDEDYQPTKTDFLKSPVPTHDTLEGDWTSWDTGKPRDWSQPEPTDPNKFSSIPGVTDQQ
ncbi:MAG TPA: secretin N-terminal domain-containing protein [Verrucomicrobiae bacterium]